MAYISAITFAGEPRRGNILESINPAGPALSCCAFPNPLLFMACMLSELSLLSPLLAASLHYFTGSMQQQVDPMVTARMARLNWFQTTAQTVGDRAPRP